MRYYSIAEIAKSFELFGEYWDPNGYITREEFDRQSVEARIAEMAAVWPFDGDDDQNAVDRQQIEAAQQKLAALGSAASLLGRKGGASTSPAKRAAARANGRNARRLVYQSRHEYVTIRIYTGTRNWIVERDSAVQGTATGERYAVPYSPDAPREWADDLAALINEGTSRADFLIDRIYTGRCLRRGWPVA